MSSSNERAQHALDQMNASIAKIKQFKTDSAIKDRLDMIQHHLDAIRNGVETSQIGFFLPDHVDDITEQLPGLQELLLRRIKENQERINNRTQDRFIMSEHMEEGGE